MAHILLVDDDRRIRDLLRRYLGQNGFRVTAAAGAAAARRKMKHMRFDLLILDVMMPGESGLDLARSLAGGGVPILLLTARRESRERIEGLEAGADDYLPKPFEPRELLLRIGNILRRVLTRGGAVLERRIRLGDAVVDLERGVIERDGGAVALNFSEQRLLAMLAASPGRIFSRAEIAAADGHGSERAVDVRINRLRRKIEPGPGAALYLRTVRGRGYMLKAG